jgi:hypothetical protein
MTATPSDAGWPCITADIACRTTPELSPSVTERVHLPQNAAVDYCGQLIQTLSTAHGRLYAEQIVDV